MKKTIGLIGVGHVGRALATHLSKAGYSIRVSNRGSAHLLKDFAKEIGPNVIAASAAEAGDSDIVVLSVPWPHLPDAVTNISKRNGQTVIDTSNNILSMNPFTLADIGNQSTGEFVAALVLPAHLVKAFNTLPAAVLASEPVTGNGNRTIVYSGDDAEAKRIASDLIASLGFYPLDLGSLHVGGKLQDAGGPFSRVDLLRVRM